MDDIQNHQYNHQHWIILIRLMFNKMNNDKFD